MSDAPEQTPDFNMANCGIVQVVLAIKQPGTDLTHNFSCSMPFMDPIDTLYGLRGVTLQNCFRTIMETIDHGMRNPAPPEDVPANDPEPPKEAA